MFNNKNINISVLITIRFIKNLLEKFNYCKYCNNLLIYFKFFLKKLKNF